MYGLPTKCLLDNYMFMIGNLLGTVHECSVFLESIKCSLPSLGLKQKIFTNNLEAVLCSRQEGIQHYYFITASSIKDYNAAV